MRFTQLTSLLIALSLPMVSLAEEIPSPQKYNNIYLGGGGISFDPKTAAQENIKSSGSYWRLGWEKVHEKWVYGLGISGYKYSDLSSLSDVVVVDQYNKESTANSGANATNLYFEGGYHHPLNAYFNLELLAGYELITYSKRGFGNCTDCPGEDIDIEAGLYLMPRINYASKSWFTVSLAYHNYLMGNIDGAYSVTIGAKF